jgi:hypothetical protein
MKRNVLLSGLTALAIAAGLSGAPASAQTTTGLKVGALTCDVASGWGFVFGSTRDLKCTYSDNNGSVERYTGHINKFGADIGYHAGGAVVWAVIAPTSNFAKGALAGNYGGVTGGAAVGVGAAASVLVGGSGQTVSLQPVSFEGITGLNVAAGIEQVVLAATE